MPFLELTKVRKSYGPKSDVGPVSLSVERGEFVSLLGPSGCGKTTMLRCIAGFTQPTSGDISIDGKSILATPPYRRDVGLVFQNYALFPHLTAFENVAFGLRLRRRPKEELARRVAQSLKLVGLQGLEQRLPSQISGGQQQRVALARSLVLEPKLLLLDEPLSNLDAKLRVQMRAELRKLQSQLGITTIYVTHEQSEALALSDRVVVMNEGLVCQISTPREMYESPRTPFVADFIGLSNLLGGQAEPAGDGAGTIVTAGRLTLRSAEVLPPVGAPAEVVVLIRPERIFLNGFGKQAATAHDGSLNRIPALVTEVTYLGEGLQVFLLVADTIPIMANIAATQGPEPHPGSHVELCVAARDVRLILSNGGRDGG